MKGRAAPRRRRDQRCNGFADSSCTEIGALDGVAVEFAPELQLVSGGPPVTVCDDHDHCASYDDS